MMPLCTTATRSVACGCALLSVGLPWVAQRVWPMPMCAVERLAAQPRFEVAQLALGAAARQRAVLERGDAGRIIAAIFEALERIDQLARDRLTAENSDNPAHASDSPLAASLELVMRRQRSPEIKTHVADVTESRSQQCARRLIAAYSACLALSSCPAAFSSPQALGPAFLNGLPAARRAPARPAGTSSVITEPEPT